MTMTENKTYKCPNCAGSITFSSSSGMMNCKYCDCEFDITAVENFSDTTTDSITDNWLEYTSTSGSGDWNSEEKSNVSKYICNSCAGEIITNSVTVASKCPYCDSPVIISSELDGVLRPDLVIQFKISTAQSKELFYNFFKNKKLLPDCFAEQSHIDEISGIYVPFWLFDCTANGIANFKGTKIRSWSDSRYIYTKTSHFSIKRSGKMDFCKIPADGSKRMDDSLMESIEPYDYSQVVDFETAYLSGFLAEKYDISSDENKSRINNRIETSLIDSFNQTIHGYSTKVLTNKNISMQNADIKYALLPVYILNTRYKDKVYTYALNGQTGKFVGDLPIDKKKVFRYFSQTFGISFAVISAIYTIFMYFGR